MEDLASLRCGFADAFELQSSISSLLLSFQTELKRSLFLSLLLALLIDIDKPVNRSAALSELHFLFKWQGCHGCPLCSNFVGWTDYQQALTLTQCDYSDGILGHRAHQRFLPFSQKISLSLFLSLTPPLPMFRERNRSEIAKIIGSDGDGRL